MFTLCKQYRLLNYQQSFHRMQEVQLVQGVQKVQLWRSVSWKPCYSFPARLMRQRSGGFTLPSSWNFVHSPPARVQRRAGLWIFVEQLHRGKKRSYTLLPSRRSLRSVGILRFASKLRTIRMQLKLASRNLLKLGQTAILHTLFFLLCGLCATSVDLCGTTSSR